MTETTFTIGTDATCTDGACGEVIRVVVDPVLRAVTHLVVEPKHRRGLGRLVPLDLVDATTDEVRLRCTVDEFDKLDYAEETQFLPGSSGFAGYGLAQALSWPYYGLGSGIAIDPNIAIGTGNAPEPVVSESVPLGEVTVARGEPVHATDGDIGRVQGLVINADRHVTHVLLQEGHLWGRKEVAIPISAVTRVDDGIRLNLSKQDVQDLPSVAIERSDA
jgi:sporulation protein YlmC with PRC-barrel domain